MSEITTPLASPVLDDFAPTKKKIDWPVWIGRGISGLMAVLLGMGGVMDLLKPPFVVEGLARAGYAESVLVPLGITVIVSALLYLIPQTALLGGLLLTAYLGGAVATHVRLGDPFFSMTMMPVYIAVPLWLGLLLRDRRLRELLPLRRA
jgi:hypothetical protein